MATRSTVAKVNEDGTVTQIYIHWNGDLEGVGAELLENYNTPQEIDALLADGDHSELCNTPVSYRSRGYSDVDARSFFDRQAYLAQGQAEEFNYLYSNGVWRVSRNGLHRFRKYNVKETA